MKVLPFRILSLREFVLTILATLVLISSLPVLATFDHCSCDAYPISLSEEFLGGVPIGGNVDAVEYGSDDINFSWLTWTGDRSTPSLAISLLPPGNSYLYMNPYNIFDHRIDAGDWVKAVGDKSNEYLLSHKLDNLLGREIIIQVRNDMEIYYGGFLSLGGERKNYRTSGFAKIKLNDYSLSETGLFWGNPYLTTTLSFEFLGYTSCSNFNVRPVAYDSQVTLEEDSTISIKLSASDENNDLLNFAITSPPKHGTLEGIAPNFIYIPDNNFNGQDTFSFMVDDGKLESDVAVISISVDAVNDQPISRDISISNTEDTSFSFTLDSTDVDGDILSFEIVSQPTRGSLTGVAPELTYKPYENFNGNDEFTYRASDGESFSNISVVDIAVSPVNDAPTSSDQSLIIDEDSSVPILLLGNDVDGDDLTYFISVAPEYGLVEGDFPDLIYSPYPGFSGADSFVYTVHDGDLSADASVNITVLPTNEPPVAENVHLELEEDSNGMVSVIAYDVDGDPLSYLIITQPEHGTLAGIAPNFLYTPEPNYFGSDIFSYQVNDGKNDSNVAKVSLVITPENDPPVANSANLFVAEDSELSILLSGSDIDGDDLSFELIALPEHGSISADTLPNLIYTPSANYSGEDRLSFKVDDGESSSAVAIVNIHIDPVNDAPTAEDLTISAIENSQFEFILSGSDIDGDALNAIIQISPKNGVVTGVFPQFLYIPNEGFTGDDYFEFVLSDGLVESNVGRAHILVSPLGNNPPVILGSPPIVGAEGQDYIYSINAMDPDGDALTFSLTNSPIGMSLSESTGELIWNTPSQGVYDISLVVADEYGLNVTQDFELFISPNLPDETSQGTEFWFMFNDNLKVKEIEYLLYITSMVDSEVRVQMPGQGFDELYSVNSNEVATIDLSSINKNIAHRSGIQWGGINVSSDSNISAYIINKQRYSTDATVIYPVASLGKEYRVSTYSRYSNSQGGVFGIVATEDGTNVEITPNVRYEVDGVTYKRGEKYSIAMDEGQTYQVSGLPGLKDLSGTLITSDKKIAVFNANRCTAIESELACDHLVEQAVPINSHGSTYLTLPLATRELGDTFRVYADEDDTYVFVDGEIHTYLSSGEFYNVIMDGPHKIHSNRPIQLMQFSNSAGYDNNYTEEYYWGDPMMLNIPAEEQYLAAYTITTPENGYARNFINLTAPDSSYQNVRLDGMPVDSSAWIPIPNSDYRGAQVEIALGTHTIASSEPFGIYVYGFDIWDSYGYTGGTAFSSSKEVLSFELSVDESLPIAGNLNCVFATVLGKNDIPIQQHQVRFESSTGENKTVIRQLELTNTAGVAEFCYRRGRAGEDVVVANIDALYDSIVVDWKINTEGNLPPVIESLPNMIANEGTIYSDQVYAYDPDGEVLSYTLDIVPDGMVIDEYSGVITWTVPEYVVPGEQFPVSVRVTDAFGSSISQRFNLIGVIESDEPRIVNSGSRLIEQGQRFSQVFKVTDRNLYEDFEWKLEGGYSDASIDKYTGAFYWDVNVDKPGSLISLQGACYTDSGAVSKLEHSTKWRRQDLHLTGLVGPLYDSNSDGTLDASDRTVLIATNDSFHIIALDAKTGQEIWKRDDFQTHRRNNVGALVNLDNDLDSEYVFLDISTRNVVALNSDGTTKWVSDYTAFDSGYPVSSAIYIADLNNDGVTEILVGPSVFNSDGQLLWHFPLSDELGSSSVESMPLAVDLDLDGYKEVIFHNQARDSDGNLLWSIPTYRLSYLAYGNFDDDPEPEIVVNAYLGYIPLIKLIDNDGEEIWSKRAYEVGNILVADFNNDGLSDIYSPASHTLYDFSGKELWTGRYHDNKSTRLSASIADVTGDGSLEILKYATNPSKLHIYAAKDGELLKSIELLRNSKVLGKLDQVPPLFVDLDNDGEGEIVVNNGEDAIVLESAENNWAPAEKFQAYLQQPIGAVRSDLSVSNDYNQDNFGLANTRAEIESTSADSRLSDIAINYVKADPADTGWNIEVGLANRGLASLDQGFYIDIYSDVISDSNKISEIQVPNLKYDSGLQIYSTNITDPGLLGSQIYASVRETSAIKECYLHNNQASASTFTVSVTDSDGLRDVEYLSIGAKSKNVLPVFEDVGGFSIEVGEELNFEVFAIDPDDNEQVIYELEDVPFGVALNSRTGEVSWTPMDDQVGDQIIKIKAYDSVGFRLLYVDVSVTTRLIDTVPVITSDPLDNIQSGTQYRYRVLAMDEESDYLYYSLVDAPEDMTINSLTGQVSWFVEFGSSGTYTVSVNVTDDAGNITNQTYDLLVRNNSAPYISSTPTETTSAGREYTYQVVVTDLDNDVLSFSLVQAPNEMSISDSGLITWSPKSLGRETIIMQVSDGAAYSQQLWDITVVNNVPEITSTPNFVARKGSEYKYQIIAIDEDGDELTYVLQSSPEGLLMSSDGYILWTPELAIETIINVSISDGFNEVLHSWPVYVTDAVIEGSIYINKDYVDDGDTLFIEVVPQGVIEPYEISLELDGVPVLVNDIGDSVATVSGVGEHVIEAVISDPYDSITLTKSVYVKNPTDSEEPAVSLISPGRTVPINSPTEVIGSVSDANLLKWRLFYVDANFEGYVELASGSANVEEQVLATFDPTLIENGQYLIVMEATDLSGQMSQAVSEVTVEGDLKVGNFSFTVQDLNIPLAGLPISVTRSYDSRSRLDNQAFGYGWSVGYQDTKVEESREVGLGWFEWTQPLNPTFPNGPQVYCLDPEGNINIAVTLPNGKVEKFEPSVSPRCFEGQPHGNGYVQLEFTAVGDNQSSLVALEQSQGVFVGENIVRGLADQSALNPDRYQLTTKTGYVYTLDQNFGVETVTDPNGNTLSYSDSGIVHSSGKSVQFVRDDENRITQIIDPAGNAISYSYDDNGDLATVTERDGAVTSHTYYGSNCNDTTATSDCHLLDDILDPLGRTIIKNIYDDAGRLVAQEDQSGNRTEFNHDITGRHSIVTDRNGNTIVYGYDDRGNVLTQVDALGHIQTYSYDERDNQLTHTDPLGNVTTSTFDESNNQLTQTNGLGYTYNYSYNERGQETTITDARGNVFTNVYDTVGNLLSITDPQGNVAGNDINTRGLVTRVVDAIGGETTYTYDDEGNKLTETSPDGVTTAYTYDENNNVLAETRTRFVDGTAVNETTQYEYDVRNRVTATTDPLGYRNETEYDLAGNEIATTDALGRRTAMAYDVYGNLLKTIYPDGTTETHTYDAEQNKTSSTDRAGRITVFEYDALNRLTNTVNPDGSSVQTEYDAVGRVRAEVDLAGNRTTYEYDAAGRQTARIDALGHRHTFAYDEDDNRVGETDANGNATTYVLNTLDQRVQTWLADGTTTSESFDANSRRNKSTDQAGISTSYGYDPMGRLTDVTDALGQVTSYTYDEYGNKLTQTDASGNTTTWTYDPLGRMLSLTLPEGQVETFVYDAVGNMTSHTDFNGQTHSYTYDINDRLISISYADGSGENYTYDAVGNRTQAIKTDGTRADVYNYGYDVLNRLIEEIQFADTDHEAVLTYEYDITGNRIRVTQSQYGTVSSTQYSYDALNRLTTVTDDSGNITTYEYDAAGNRIAVQYANGTTTSYGYDPLHRLVELAHTGDNGVLQSFSYQLDVTGRRTQISEANGRVTAYGYDSLYRLVSEDITDLVNGDYSATYGYDATGNRTSQTVNGLSTLYSYDGNDRILQQDDTHYTYDDNGNTLTETQGVNVRFFSYNSQNELISVSAGNDTEVTYYQYNPDGIRTGRSDQAGDTRYLVDSNRDYAQVLLETSPLGEQIVYTYGDDLISQKTSQAFRFYHYDGLGSTRILSDSSGEVTDTYSYEAFGELLDQAGNSVNDYLFTGEQYDGTLDQYYLRARYYDQGVGRFTQMDTWTGVQSNPITLNKYLYANAEPVVMVDPSGHFSLVSTSTSISIHRTLSSISVSRTFGFSVSRPGVGGTIAEGGIIGAGVLLMAPGFDLRNAAVKSFILANEIGNELMINYARDMYRDAGNYLKFVSGLTKASMDLYGATSAITNFAKAATNIPTSVHTSAQIFQSRQSFNLASIRLEKARMDVMSLNLNSTTTIYKYSHRVHREVGNFILELEKFSFFLL